MQCVARFLLVVPGWVFLVAGCGRTSVKPPAAGHPLPAPCVARCEAGQPGGVLTLPLTGLPQTFNPVLAEDAASDEVVRLLFSSLVSLDLGAQEIRPGLAESWSVGSDQKTWTFQLRPELRWSDGRPLTADDVVFTWNEVMLDPDFNRLTYELFRIGGRNCAVSQVDERTVRVVMPEPFAPFLEFFGRVPVLPRHILQQAVRERRFLSVYTVGSRPERVVGSGPFRLKENRTGQFILLERNPEYWVVDSRGRRLPYFDQVRLVPTPGPGAAAMLFFSGRCDVFERMKPADFELFNQAATNASMHLVNLGAGTERDFLWFNLNTGADASGKPYVNPVKLAWFRNQAFRQAVACALDRDRMVREAYGGRAEATDSFISAENPKWNNSNVAHYAYDPARARVLLAGIGLQDRNGDGVIEDAEGHPVEITFNTNTGNPPREKCAGIIAEDLRRLGFKVDYQPMPFPALVERVNRTFDFECVVMGVAGGGMDPASQINVLRSSEPLHQWFPNQTKPATDWEARVDQLMDAQMRTLDFAQRKRAYDEVQAIFSEELPMICTVAPFNFAAIRADVGNVRPSSLTPFRLTWNVEELYFKKP